MVSFYVMDLSTHIASLDSKKSFLCVVVFLRDLEFQFKIVW